MSENVLCYCSKYGTVTLFYIYTHAFGCTSLVCYKETDTEHQRFKQDYM